VKVIKLLCEVPNSLLPLRDSPRTRLGEAFVELTAVWARDGT
jgi:hypothetical protein